MLGNNVKIHFAGSDGEEIFYEALNAADVHYRLYSCYKYIVNKKPGDDFTLPENHVIRAQCRDQKHVIQDSGLFTLMFGAGKGQKQTIETLTVWQDKLVEFVRQNHLTASIVEIDCQKVLGVDEAWYFRERMKKLLPNNTQINVFHFEDGRKGLDRLIEFSDYIAVSVPEWRIVKRKTHKQDIRYITHYIKNKKPEIDIHLLGCTDFKIIAENNFCTSADSTSWLSGVKYGYFDDGHEKAHVNEFKPRMVAERKAVIQSLLNARGVQLKPKTLTYSTNASLCAYYASQSWDVYVFHKLRNKFAGQNYTGAKRWIWNNGSTLTSQIIDTVIYSTISFGIGMGWLWTSETRISLLGLMVGQYLLKACLALLDTPLFYFFTRRVNRNAGGSENGNPNRQAVRS